MSTLTETEYRTLRMKTLAILGEIGARDNTTATAIAANLVPTVDDIVAARVAAALSVAADRCAALAEEPCRDSFERGWREGLHAAVLIVREVAA